LKNKGRLKELSNVTHSGFPIEEALRAVEKHVKKFQLPWLDKLSSQKQDPFKVLVSCLLSLRTQDRTTAIATQRLFSKIQTPEDLTGISVEELEKLIYPVGFYRTKARRLKQIARILIDKYNSRVPDNMDSLLSLPGVGRKTANIVLSLGYQKNAIAVDTHVHRITNRWGFVKTRTPEQTEKALMARVPMKYWRKLNSLLVAFGQVICKPITPVCSRCLLADYCPKIGVKKHR